jgi:hypothetical protein
MAGNYDLACHDCHLGSVGVDDDHLILIVFTSDSEASKSFNVLFVALVCRGLGVRYVLFVR